MRGDHAHCARIPGVHRAKAHHAGVDGAHVAGDDRLHRRDDVARDEHGIDRHVRMRAMTPASVDRDLDAVGRSHRRARRDADAPGRQTGPVVQREHLVRRETHEESIVDHGFRTGVALLPRLEDEVRRAVEIARLVQVTRSREQHRRVSIVAAAVHPAVVTRFVRELVFLLHRQRVHVGTQADGTAAGVRPAANHRNDTGLADSGVVLDSECRESFADDFRGSVLLEAQLRMHVQVAAHGREFGVPAGDVPNGIFHRCPQCAASRSMRRRGSTA